MSIPTAQLESILLVAARPLSIKKLVEISGASEPEVRSALAALMEEYSADKHGIQLSKLGESYQFSTSAETSPIVQKFLDEEDKKELTKPSLETLTIVAYRGPVTKAELELIRGVNCSMILRNLLIRGLIEETVDPITKSLRYQVTFDFLQYLGIREPKELPDFEKLNSNENLEQLLKDSTKEDAPDDHTSLDVPTPSGEETDEPAKQADPFEGPVPVRIHTKKP